MPLSAPHLSLVFAPIVARLEDEAERLEEARASWEDAGQMAATMVAHARRELHEHG